MRRAQKNHFIGSIKRLKIITSKPLCNLASYYHNQDINKAIYYYQKAAKLNDSQAMLELSYLYENGEGVEKDDKKAVELLEKAFHYKI